MTRLQHKIKNNIKNLFPYIETTQFDKDILLASGAENTQLLINSDFVNDILSSLKSSFLKQTLTDALTDERIDKIELFLDKEANLCMSFVSLDIEKSVDYFYQPSINLIDMKQISLTFLDKLLIEYILKNKNSIYQNFKKMEEEKATDTLIKQLFVA